MSLIQFVRIFWSRRSIILIAAICSVLGGYVVTLLVPPRYEAVARVMFNFTKPDPISGEFLSMGGAGAFFTTQTELIKDYRVASRAAEALGLSSDPMLIAEYNARPSSDNRDFSHWLAQRVSDETEPNIQGTVLEIKFRASTPAMAKRGAEAVRQSYLDESLAGRRAYGAKNAAWYNQQALGARRAAEAAELAKANFERQHGVVMSGENDLDSQRLAALAGAAAVPSVAAAPISSGASLQLAQIDANITQASKELGPNHPQLQALQQQRRLVAGVVARDEAAARAAASGAAGVAVINRALQEQKARVISERDKAERLRQLQSEVDLRRDQYKRTAQRAAELSLEAAVADTGLTPLGVAVAPSAPAFPNKALMVGGAGALGLGLGLALALLLELLDRRVRGVEDLDLGPGAPCIGIVREPFRLSSNNLFDRLAKELQRLGRRAPA